MTNNSPNTDAGARLPPVEERVLHRVLRRQIHARPDHVALRGRSESLTYGQLWERAGRVGGGFVDLGLERGDRVATLLDNSVDAVLVWTAVALQGLVHVALNTAYRGEFLVRALNETRAKLVVVDSNYAERIQAIRESLPLLEHLVVRGDRDGALTTEVSWENLPAGRPRRAVEVQPWDLAEVRLTSGTTGRSKGVKVSHIQAYTHSSPAFTGVAGEDDVNLVALPLFHLAGQWALVYNAMIGGGSSVVLEKFSASRFWDDVRAFGCTHTVLLGGMADFLRLQPARPDDADNSMQLMYTMPIRPWYRDFERRFGVRFYTAYGSTEAGQPLLATPDEIRIDGCGFARPDFDVAIVDEHDRPVAVGETGELVVRPRDPWVSMLGYDGQDDATVRAWRNLWFHTGDRMRADEDGHYFFVDRLTDSIRRRGENISAAEVEEQVLLHDEVLECAVIGVPSEHSEEEVKVVAVLRDDSTLDPADLIDFLLPRLASYMLPRYVEYVRELPRTPTQKVRKNILREAGITLATWDAEGKR